MIRFALCLVFIVQIYCQTVHVQYYSDSLCQNLSTSINWTISESCVAADSKQNFSASNFQCYHDSLCYVLYSNSTTCDSNTGEISYATNECTPPLANSNNNLYSKIISGTELCDPTPDNFVCEATNDYQEEEEEEDEPLMVPRDWTIVIFLVLVLICECIAVVRAVILYKRGPPPTILSDQLTMEDLTVEGLDVNDPFTLSNDDEDLTVQ